MSSAIGAATVTPVRYHSTPSSERHPLSMSLANVSVRFNNMPAPLHFVPPGQINAQLPWDTLPPGTLSGTATVVVTRGMGMDPPCPAGHDRPFAPVTYSFNNLPIAINPDGTLAQPVGSDSNSTAMRVLPAPARPVTARTAMGGGECNQSQSVEKSASRPVKRMARWYGRRRSASPATGAAMASAAGGISVR
ncbi:MAG: hypothetical protein KIT09_06085 [Bryobacteraceae bacterium]|nr:hypothetical protein [Bryobacteraceae bacterium]